MRGHSTVLVTLGYFVLAFGFLAFNGGSLYYLHGQSYLMGKIVVNTMSSGCAASLSAIYVNKLWKKKISLICAINGGLTGFVAICAGANDVEVWASFIIGRMLLSFFFIFILFFF